MQKTFYPQQRNMRLLSQDTLGGFGGVGEGIAMQCLPDGRRVLWLAHEGAPKNFTAVDVSDPRRPRVLVQTDLPHAHVRSNSLEVSGNLMAVAYQVSQPGLAPAGFDLFDISQPEKPRLLSHFDASAPHSRGAHCLWFVDGQTVHMACGDPELVPRNPKDDQVYRIVDVSNPTAPKAIGRWHMPGTMEGDDAPPPTRLAPEFDSGFRAHNTNVYPQRPDRCYLGYLDGGAFIMDISDLSNPKPISRFMNSPPFKGFTHTALPLFGRNLMVVSDETVQDNAADWPKLVWLVDISDEKHPISIATLPMPPVDIHKQRGGRYGAHNVHENTPVPGSWKSEDMLVCSYFNGGIRAYDIRDPYSPQEVAYFVPEAPAGSPAGSIQFNDVFVDDRGIVFAVDRHAGGLYAIEMTV
ncbi:hypothetical protein RE432_16385 [Pusillimonas sp. SM2304]|uniref:LVIVD repeat-containing protein n=1 Tax=Pusillimonas sp. SM2304 TaxID=3073241 RepID=UPI00287633F9|nr:hypothetical protein [Pusillimonas sp. SM2304]MDS1142020.1 hypothetical protein [Pusillimonas sp. SM2304]